MRATFYQNNPNRKKLGGYRGDQFGEKAVSAD